jgi:TolA-binding protein
VTVVDLHPEDLLERDARGELDDAERARLQQHLARCAACRFERQLRADFAEELDAELPPAAYAGLVEHLTSSRVDNAPPETARDAAPTLAPSLPPLPIPSLPSRRRRGRGATWLLAAAALFAVSVAGATGLGGRAWLSLVGGTPAATQGESNEDTLAPPKPRSRPRSPSPRSDELVDTSNAPSIVAPIASQEPSPGAVPEEPKVSPAPEGAVVRTSAPLRAPRAITALTNRAPISPASNNPPFDPASMNPVSASQAAAPPKPGTDAAALFDAANDARRQGDYARTLALHRELQTRHGQSREAQVSRATVGRLLLDRGDPGGALTSFDAYLAAGGGELGEEAMAGRATALERLGRADEARRGWEALLTAFPSTPYAAHARARARLGPPSSER